MSRPIRVRMLMDSGEYRAGLVYKLAPFVAKALIKQGRAIQDQSVHADQIQTKNRR